MTKPKRPKGSIDQIFNRILLASFVAHVAMGLLLMNVEPPPPPSQEQYVNLVKKLSAQKPVEEKPKAEEKPKEKTKKEEVAKEEVAEAPTKAPMPSAKERREKVVQAPAKPGESVRRAEVRKQLSGAGLLATIGASSDEGGLANVFESESVVSKDLGSVLSERGGVRVSGGTRIGKKGALGRGTTGDIGEVEVGTGGSVGAGESERRGAVPQAFVKSSEPVLKKGKINEQELNLALRRRERGIQACYERSLKSKSSLRGELVLQWAITDQGRAIDVKIVKNTVGPEVGNCVSDIISKIRFPKAPDGETVVVQKSFVFEKSG